MRTNPIQTPRQELAALAGLRPTQVTVGFREVTIKRRRWRETHGDAAEHFLWAKRIPTILGPGGHRYLVDRHHLARALFEEGVAKWPVMMVADYSQLDQRTFWATLETLHWVHPFDDRGHRHDYNDLPMSIGDLTDDPYRSLAGAVKRAGIYRKDKAPFSEFYWANFFRSRIDRTILDRDFDFAVTLASELAASPDAMLLPGWRANRARLAPAV